METREARMMACDARAEQREIITRPAVVETAAEHNGSALRKLASIEEVANASSLCRSTIYKLIKTGELRSVRLSRRHLVYIDSYIEMLKRHETAERPANPSP
jgi:excisionase family DNA binding protein